MYVQIKAKQIKPNDIFYRKDDDHYSRCIMDINQLNDWASGWREYTKQLSLSGRLFKKI